MTAFSDFFGIFCVFNDSLIETYRKANFSNKKAFKKKQQQRL